MKKLISLLSILVLIFSLAVPVSARSYNMEKGLTPITIKDPDGIISMPDDFIIVPSYTSPSDPVFEELNQDGKSFMKDMKDLNVVIYGSSKDFKINTYLSVVDSEGVNYSDYESDELLDLAKDIAEALEKDGAEVSDYGLSAGVWLNYIYIVYKNSDGRTYTAEFFSQYEGKMYGYSYSQIGSPLSDDQIGTAKAISTSLTVEEESFFVWDEDMNIFIDCPPTAYSDPGIAAANESEAAVKLPEGTGSYLFLTCEKGADVPKGNVTREKAADFFGISASSLKTETYGNNRYFTNSVKNQTIEGGNPSNYTYYNYLIFHNGGAYLLTFTIDQYEEGLNDDIIEKMLEFVSFL